MKTLAYLPIVAVLLSGGCSTLQVKSTPAPGANLSRYRTFAFMMPRDPASQAGVLAQSPTGQEIQATIAQSLQSKGYVPAQAGQPPDFLIAYNRVLQNKVQVEDWGYPGPVWGWGAPATVNEYTEGTVVVDFVDAGTHQVIWRGTASRVVDDPLNPDLHKVHESIAKLMESYPQQVATAPPPARM